MGYYVQVIYDDEKIKLPWCSKGYLCTATEFIQYFENNLMTDMQYIEDYCDGKVGDFNYINNWDWVSSSELESQLDLADLVVKVSD